MASHKLRKYFPRATTYDPQWVQQHSMGENVLFNLESLTEKINLKPGMRVLDLGCGKAISSVFLATEFGVQVWAVDEAISATENLERIRRADVFFFTGGDQRRIADFLRGTQVLQIMRERYITDEIVIAGTSAGAVALSDRMIYEGYGSYSLEKGRTKTSTALSFVHGVYIDSHFTERGRFGRLAMAVAKWPDYIGIGLGEGTGVIIREGDQIEAFGIGVVTIIDGSKIISTNLNEVEFGAPVAVENLTMHFLVEGYRYCLNERLFQPVEVKVEKG